MPIRTLEIEVFTGDRTLNLGSRDTLRHLVSFFDLDVKLDKDRRTWTSPAFG